MSKNLVEVELRAKITADILKKIKSKILKESKEHDKYFRYETDIDKTWIVRIRSKGKKHILTYKSSKKFGEGTWDEVNVPIGKRAALQLASFFEDNEHRLEVEIAKFRRTFKIDDMEINIDEIENLGIYIEAEILSEVDEIEDAKNRIKSLSNNTFL